MSDPAEFVTVHFSKLRFLDKSNARLWERVRELERIVANLAGVTPPAATRRRRAPASPANPILK
jgi:hypothetical protein